MGFLDLFRRSKNDDQGKPPASSGSSGERNRGGDIDTPSGMDADMLASIAGILDQSEPSGNSGAGKTSYLDRFGDKVPSGTSEIVDVEPSVSQVDFEPTPDPEPPKSDAGSDTSPTIGRFKEPVPESKEPDEELLSALAELLGQGSGDTLADPTPAPVPQSDPTPAPSADPTPAPQPDPKPVQTQGASSGHAVDDDFLNAIAEIMWQGDSAQGGGNAGGSSNEPKEPKEPEIEPVNPAVAKEFWRLYEESLQFKDSGRLASAIAKRKEGYDISASYEGLRGMACHNIAILSMYHLGNGQEAAHYARKSLECGESYRQFSEESRDIIQFGAHLESLQVAAYTSSSYDEAERYIDEGAKLYGDVFDQMKTTIVEYKAKYPRFFEYQRAASLQYYSRVSAEQDKGDYAPGMAMLQLIIDHAKEPAYDLSYKELVDVLDDYGTITIMYLLKKAQANGLSHEEFAQELAFIADEPLKRIAEFLPDCQPSDRELFDRIVKGFQMLPGVVQRDAFAPFR